MDDPSANSSDRGFVPFRAATALARGEEGGRPSYPRVPPPLPPPPPGVVPREVPAPTFAAPASAPSSPAASAPRAPGQPRLPVLPPGATRAEAWQALVDWCVLSGLAEGGLLAERGGTLLETRGDLPVRDPAYLARSLCSGLAAARESSGEAPAAAALDLGGRWITAFPVGAPGGVLVVAALWGGAPLRSAVRTALAGWLSTALSRAA